MKISKRSLAGSFTDNEIIKEYVSVLWSPNRGSFENLFKVVFYISPFIPGVGLLPSMLAWAGSLLLGVDPGSLGRALDNILGTGPGVTPDEPHFNRLERLLGRAFEQVDQRYPSRAALIKGPMVKEAGIFSLLLRRGEIASKLVGMIKKVVITILGVYTVASIDDMLRKITEPAREMITGRPGSLWDEPERTTPRPDGVAGDQPEPKPQPEPKRGPWSATDVQNVNSYLDELEQKYGLGQKGI